MICQGCEQTIEGDWYRCYCGKRICGDCVMQCSAAGCPHIDIEEMLAQEEITEELERFCKSVA